MNDFNFFSPYIQIKKTSRTKQRYIVITVVTGIIVVGGISFWTNYNLNKIMDEISQKEEYLKSAEIVKNIQGLNEKKRNIDILNEYFHLVSEINNDISRMDKIGIDLINTIAGSIPKDISFDMLSIDIKNIQIQGKSKERLSIAEFQHNLKSVDEFNRVHVVDISKEYSKETEDEIYVFVIKCTLKDVK